MAIIGKQRLKTLFDSAPVNLLLAGGAHLLAPLVRVYAQWPLVRKYFHIWEQHGVHLTPVHYYSPIPDTRQLPDTLWQTESTLPGLALNEAAQVQLLNDACPRFQAEYNAFPHAPTADPHQFHYYNYGIEGPDAPTLHCMIRHFQPARIIEIGSGSSTLIAAKAALLNGKTRLTCVEPYPNATLKAGVPGVAELIPQRLQTLDPAWFQQLQRNDILFIDSSHIVSIGSDVNYLLLEIIPRLNPGVIVHFHDIFLPQEFPREWIMEQRWFWAEQYLLQAFLAYNSAFEILLANRFLSLRQPALLRELFPNSPSWNGSSFWIRRK